MKNVKSILHFIWDFAVYFALCAFVVTCAFLLFFQGMEIEAENVKIAAVYTFFNVVFIALIITVMDRVRRRISVDIPVRRINEALERIEAGDFSTVIETKGSGYAFAQIMESINKMTNELKGVETLRTDFIANVSHEMKTPLAIMQNYATLLQNPDLSQQERIEYAREIKFSAAHMADLLTNILRLNRLENQQIYPESKSFDLGEQLCECLLQYEDIWEEKNIEIETDIAENIVINSDRELLSIVWNNLFSNAFKFTGNGGKVSVSLNTNQSRAVVCVQDTGCGMSADVGAHVFEKFYQADTSHATAGNGLGLALVKRIIDITGGEIQVESAVGKGTKFTVILDFS